MAGAHRNPGIPATCLGKDNGVNSGMRRIDDGRIGPMINISVEYSELG